MLNLLAVSAGKHVLLGCDKKCTRPALHINGLTLEEVSVVLDIWFTVTEHMPFCAGIKLVLALPEGMPINLGDIASRLRLHRSAYIRHYKVQGDCPDLKFKLVDPKQRLIAILGKPLHQYWSKAAGLCLCDPDERRMRLKCAVFEKWNGDDETEPM
ncbi:hypothetical protein NCC49_005267 [Naganishia albida]|nr:hypothetical protein NCC49_005267 [Naganishia albida]